MSIFKEQESLHSSLMDLQYLPSRIQRFQNRLVKVDADTAAKLGIPANEDPNASYPRLSYGGNDNNQQKSTFWLKNGSYLRLKTLEVGYTLPKSIVNKIKFNNIRVFFIGTNLLTFAKFKEWDPELGSSTGAEYPLSRVMTLGLTVNI